MAFTASSDLLDPARFDAVLFDLDGVLTATAKLHGACWKRMFDDFLRRRADETGTPFKEFDIATDYKLYVDGKPRFEGVKSFLESRGIELPYGDPGEPPGYDTVTGLGNLKNKMINRAIETEGVEVFEESIALVRRLHAQGIMTAVVSSSRNCEAVLKAAGIADLFEVKVDGVVAARFGLAGKPKPDTYLAAAVQLGVEPGRAVVVEDAISGVQAGRDGKFGLVIGVARKGDADALKQNGADVVVTDLGDLLPRS